MAAYGWLQAVRPDQGQPRPAGVRPCMRMDGTAMQRRRMATRGDHAPELGGPRLSTHTNFKAPIKTKRFNLEPSHLHYSKEGTLGYQQQLQHDTPS